MTLLRPTGTIWPPLQATIVPSLWFLQKRIQSPESVSRHLFATGFQLALHLDLVAGSDDLAARRSHFATETRHLVRQLDAIEAIALVEFRRLPHVRN